MRQFTKIPRVPRRIESEPEYSLQVWQPTWKCFCCHDTGFVKPHLAAMVIEEYDAEKDKKPICQNTGCSADLGEAIMNSDILDWRLDAAICLELDKIERKAWDEWRTQQHQMKNKAEEMIDSLAKSKSLRQRDRSSTEKMEAQQKHLCVLASMNAIPNLNEEEEDSLEEIRL